MAEAIREAYTGLGADDPPLAVRSSATTEDLADLSLAGQYDTYLNVRGVQDVLDAVPRCWASLWTARAIGYRVFRIDPSLRVHWLDVDYPDVIDLRRQLYPERAACRLIGSSLEDLRWLDEAPRDRPVLTVAEGVLPYLAQGDGTR